MTQPPPGEVGPPENGPENFEIAEARLAEQTGIAQKTLAEKRAALAEGRDWSLVGKEVAYSRAGLQRLLGSLGLTDAVDAEELAAHAALTSQDGLEKPAAAEGEPARVVRFFTNPHLLEVKFADERRVRVRVRSAAKFKLGMIVPVKLEQEGGEMYVLTRKEPRWQGKW